MILVHAADLLRNDDIDALILRYCEAEPTRDELSNETTQRVVRDLWLSWWMSEVWSGSACEEWECTQ